MGLKSSKSSKKEDVEKIRVRIKHGKITKNETHELKNRLNDYMRRSKRRSTKQLINVTLQELEQKTNRKEEPRDHPPKSIQEIKHAIDKINAKLRDEQMKNEDYDGVKAALEVYSEQLENLRKDSHEREIEEIKQTIANIKEEMLCKNVKLNLDIFEAQLDTFNGEVKVAEENKDLKKIEDLYKSIETLGSNLQNLGVSSNLLNNEKKNILDTKVLRLHEHLHKVLKQLSLDTNVHNSTIITKYLIDLDRIRKDVDNICETLNNDNFEDSKKDLDKHKHQLDSIEDIDQEIILNKSEVFDALSNAENAYARLEAENKLAKAQQQLNDYRENLTNFTEQKQALFLLKEEIMQVLEVTQGVSDIKNTLITDLDKTMAAVDILVSRNDQQPSNLEQEVPPTQELQGNDKLDSGTLENKDVGKILSNIEEELQNIEPKIYSFVGLVTSEQYFELNETLIRYTLTLDSLKLDVSGGQHGKKIELLRQINKLNDVLDEVADHTQEMVQVEQEVKETFTTIDSFRGHLEESDCIVLKDCLNKLKDKLNNIDDKLAERKQQCRVQIGDCFAKIEVAAKDKEELSLSVRQIKRQLSIRQNGNLEV